MDIDPFLEFPVTGYVGLVSTVFSLQRGDRILGTLARPGAAVCVVRVCPLGLPLGGTAQFSGTESVWGEVKWTRRVLTLLLAVICLEIGSVLWSDSLTAHSDFPEARGWPAGLAQSVWAMVPT